MKYRGFSFYARHPEGCLSIQGALAVGDEAGPIKKWLIQARKHGESVARKWFENAKKTGELATNADPAAVASYFATLLQGLCVQAAGGATRAEMTRVVDTALRHTGIQDGGVLDQFAAKRYAQIV